MPKSKSQRNLSDLKPANYNPRKCSKDEYEKISESIDTFGDLSGIIYNRTTGNLVGGHLRTKIFKSRKPDIKIIEEFESPTDCGTIAYGTINITGIEPFSYREVEWDLDKEREANIKANSRNYQGSWDFDLLANEFSLEELTDWNFETEILNIDPIEEDEKEENITEEDNQVPEAPVIPKSAVGDIYELDNGNGLVHRIMCGDSTNITDVDKLMNGKRADVGFNDPPYGMKKERDGVKNDNLNFDDLLQFNKDWINLQFAYLKDNGSWYCWGIDEPLMDIYSNIIKPYIKSQKATFRNLITWDKGNGQGQMSEEFRMYPRADEKCLFIMMGVQGFNNNSDNYFEKWEGIRSYLENEAKKVGIDAKKLKEITGVQMYNHWFGKSQWVFIPEEHYIKIQEYCGNKAFNKKYNELKKEYYSTRAYFNNTHDNQNNVWHFEREKERKHTGGHATPKPIQLCQRAIKSSCPKNGLVIDVFGGSGSTLIACEKTGRNCYMMELEPKYIDVILERWVKVTGKDPIRLNDNKKWSEIMD